MADRRRVARRAGAALLAAAPALAFAQAGGGMPSGGMPGLPGGSGATGVPGAAPIGVGANPQGRRYTVEPGIRASVVASDNLDLQPDATAKSGQLFELMPYVTATLNSPRGVGGAFYGLRGQIRNGGIDPRDEIRHDLRAWGDLKITEDSFRVYARANVYDVNASPFGVTSADPGAQRFNRTQYKDFELAPYAFGRFDGEGSWTARYSLRYIDPGSSFQSSTINDLTGSARSDLVRRRFGVSVNGQFYRVGYENGLDYDGSVVDLLGWYRVDATLRVGLGVGYSSNSILYNPKGENSGFGASAAAEWTPDPRTFVRARWSDRYYGNSGEIRASHRAANWIFGLDGYTGLNDGNRSGLNGINTASLFNAGAPVGSPAGIATNPVTQSFADQNVVSPAGTSYGSGVINSPLVYVDSLIASVGWNSTRNSVFGTVFVNNRRAAVAFVNGSLQDVDQYGGSLRYTHRLDARNAVNAIGTLTRSQDNLTDATANLRALWLTYDYRLTARSIATAGVRVQRQRGDGATVEYDEAAVLASFDYRF